LTSRPRHPRRTSATASAPCTGVRRPSANVAIFTPRLPSAVPIMPITPERLDPSQQKSAFQRSFERDSVERENSRRAIWDHGSFDGEFGTAIGRNYVKRIRKAALAAPRSFFHRSNPRARRRLAKHLQGSPFRRERNSADRVSTALPGLRANPTSGLASCCITNADGD